MKTIAERWREVEPANLTPAEMRKARDGFYLGFAAMMQAGADIGELAGESADVGESLVNALHQEFTQYQKDHGHA